MLSREDNELLCRVGRGTEMGDLLRQYWLPFLPSTELPEPDGAPKKVRLLGEDLVAFRDTRGDVGLMAANCPHRGASLFFGRNEDCGIRCVYHGWKFDVSGRCVDMPNERAESTFKDKVRARAYPCRDVNGVLWTYMGPRAEAPAFPAFEINSLPADHVYPPLMMLEECNWVQALEGDIDSSHIDYVHAKLRPDSKQRGTFHQDKRPRLELLPTDYGACYSARRRWDVDGLYWHRITQFIMPFFSMIAASDPNLVSARAWVPLDDNYNLQIMMRGRLDRPVTDQERELTRNPFAGWGGYVEATSEPHTRYYTKANIHNDYLVDRQLAKNELMIGIPFLVNLQDRAMTETMGPIYDRTQEHLGTTDAMVIYVRRRLIEAARALREHGVVPANVDDGSLCRVRAASVLLPEGDSWISATEKARQSDAGVPIAWVPFAQ
jgi:phthalate 4,5-dioxygenase